MFYARDLLAIDDWNAVYSQPVTGHWHTLAWSHMVGCVLQRTSVALRTWDLLIMLFSLNNMAEDGYCYLQISSLTPI